MLIQADMHTHTVASTHAYSTVTENCIQAQKIGVKCIAMTDHAMYMPDSPHIWHFGNMSVLPREIFGVTVLKGAEANIIDYEGNLDIVDGKPYMLEFLIASYHRYYFADFAVPSPKTVTDGYMKLFENPSVDVIGHPTTAKFPVEWDRFVKGALEFGKLPELNESSVRTGKTPPNIVVEMLRTCKKYGCSILVNTDSHFWSTVGQTPLCEKILTEADFPRSLVANANWEELRAILLHKRPYLDI